MSVQASHELAFVALDERGSASWPIPRLLRSTRSLPESRRAVQACPAVNEFERRIVEVLAPFSLRIRCIENRKGGFDFHLIEQGTRIDQDVLSQLLSFMPRDIWRTKGTPVVQIALPHIFLSDDPLFLTQMPAWASDNAICLPGMLVSGRFPAHVWPRSLNLAFEWQDRTVDFVMKRGQPICYMFAETSDPSARLRLIEGMMTPELSSYLAKISDVVKYTSGSFNLFERANEIRPQKLVKELVR